MGAGQIASFVGFIVRSYPPGRRSGPLRRGIHAAFFVVSLPLELLIDATALALFVALRSLSRLTTRLLAGPDRLRALVFGTGLVLLFGGLGAQFYATF